MARSYVAREMVALGGQPQWREGCVTDNGGHILDVRNLDLSNPIAMEKKINDIPGVICVGIFALRRADVVLLGAPEGIRTLTLT
jgi:ribose 5-phosphate isomerase A